MDLPRHLIAPLCLVTALLAGCVFADDSDPDPPPPNNSSSNGQVNPGCEASTFEGMPVPDEGSAIGWQWIDADEGGTVQVPDGAVLEVPPSALPCDTRITISVPANPDHPTHFYRLEPNGLRFDEPVTLHIPGEPPAIAYIASDDAEIVEGELENTNWRHAVVVPSDREGYFGVELEHFSVINAVAGSDAMAYLVLDIPPKYLVPGDIIIVMTNLFDTRGVDWAPGHAALLYDIDPGGNRSRVIESTPNTVRFSPHANVIGSVQNHLSMGARRPPGSSLTIDERKELLAFARRQLGKDYSLVGQGNLDEDSWSCAGLVEGSYDHIDRGLLSWYWAEWFAPAPLDLYLRSEAVDEITVDVGETVRIPVYGVVAAPSTQMVAPYIGAYYENDAGNYQVTMSGEPEKAILVDNERGPGRVFEWTPELDDACETSDTPCPSKGEPHEVEFHMTARTEIALGVFSGVPYRTIEKTQKLTINVTGHSRVQTYDANDDGVSHGIQVDVPVGVTVQDTHFLHEESRQPIADDSVVDGWQFDSINEFDVAGGAKRIEFTTTWVGSGTPAPITVRYYVDYEVPRWTNKTGE